MFRFFRFLALPKIVIRERIVRIKLDTCFNVDITITVWIPQLLVSDGVIRLVVSVSDGGLLVSNGVIRLVVSVSDGGLLVSDGVIHLVVSVSALAWFKTYIYYCYRSWRSVRGNFNIMAKRTSTKRQATIYKTYT
jgi:hypothetical protein